MDGSDGQSVLLRREGAVAVVTLNEPASLNALSAGIKDGIEAHIPALVADSAVRAIVITGTGRAFCAGGDIRAFDQRDTTAMRLRMQRTYRWLVPLLTSDKPVVTAVNGVAAGAGFSLALAGDVVCASTEAKFKPGFPGIGAVPDLALAYALPRAVGMVRAKDILLFNREVSATLAHEIGMVAHLAEPDMLMDTALDLAGQLAAGPTLAFGLTKQLLQRAFELPLEGFLELEAMAQTTAFGSADFTEGVAAFRGKRKPDFKGG
ncbi:enoyl-CoA hydratase-related protein [Thalassobaculum sp.]|uniref:enoyl-CoA hydratase/isomerase family protein n=1 Tax=Thalassobaculum sp. TaxID=2022740 RepID=UPI0032EB6AE3